MKGSLYSLVSARGVDVWITMLSTFPSQDGNGRVLSDFGVWYVVLYLGCVIDVSVK